MQTSQVQLKISLSMQLSDLLHGRAQQLGVPVTQFVKHIIIKEVEKDKYPTYIASEQLEKITEKALKEIDKSEVVEDIDEFFQSL